MRESEIPELLTEQPAEDILSDSDEDEEETRFNAEAPTMDAAMALFEAAEDVNEALEAALRQPRHDAERRVNELVAQQRTENSRRVTNRLAAASETQTDARLRLTPFVISKTTSANVPNTPNVL